MRFHKYHGLGNDFVVADLREGAPSPSPLDADFARRLCDRRFGVGADGVLAILPSERGVAGMRIRNADGSEPEMCGNGIRCVAKHLWDGGLRRSPMPIETASGVLDCVVIEDADGRAGAVTVAMGRPLVEAAAERIDAGGRSFSIARVSMGNPHAVAFVDEDPLPLAERYGPLIERHERFPARTNVEFARMGHDGGVIDVRVWERGCGITLACGTGACATAAAAVTAGLVPAGADVDVRLPGGTLRIRVAGDLSQVWMTGPATHVFSAELA
jgi:diaminopimelate epimerase